MKYRQSDEKAVGLLRTDRINLTFIYTKNKITHKKMQCSLVQKTTLIPKKCTKNQLISTTSNKKVSRNYFRIPYNKQNWGTIKFK